jgi:peptide/nickel transport system ATP-binding protein
MSVPGVRAMTSPGTQATSRPPDSQDIDPVLEIRGLCVDYGFGDDAVHAVADCDLTLGRGRVLGLAGESGSGKSTLAMAAIRLLRSPGVITGGEVLFHSRSAIDGEPATTVDLLAAGEEQLRAVRWSEIAIVLQSALNALNPVSTIGAQFDELLATHRPGLGRASRRERAAELLELPPRDVRRHAPASDDRDGARAGSPGHDPR